MCFYSEYKTHNDYDLPEFKNGSLDPIVALMHTWNIVHYRKYLLKNVSKIVKIVHSANSAVGVFSLHNAYSVIPFGNWIFIACRMCSFLNSENINCPELERSDQKRSDHDKKVCDWDHFSAKLPIHSHPIWQGINFFDHFFSGQRSHFCKWSRWSDCWSYKLCSSLALMIST